MNKLIERIDIAVKKRPADVVVKGGRIINVFSHEIIEADIAICGNVIAAVGKGYDGKKVMDAKGKFVSPGLIDAHIHMESSMLRPRVLGRSLLACGTTTIIADPHEIANVAGMDGIQFMMDETDSGLLDAFFMAPSCVPASHLDTSGARLGAEQLRPLTKNSRILGLAEVMNYPGVVAASTEVLAKIELFADRIIDGHAPGLSGEALQAYVSAGIRSDHECTTRDEALEKLRAGMTVMIREGTAARNLAELMPLVTYENASRFCLVSDDLHPQELLKEGHMNRILRRAVSAGMDPVLALRLATFNPASFFRLYDRGAIGPGYRADIVVFGDLEQFQVCGVLKDGKIIIEDGHFVGPPEQEVAGYPSTLKVMKVPELTAQDFIIPCKGKNRARVIELIEGQILTRAVIVEIEGRAGNFDSDLEKDILKVAVVERYSGSGRTGLGLVRGFGIKKGAIASSVAHDSHNIVAVGVDSKEIAAAINGIIDMDGGLIVTQGGQPVEKLPLPICGLMSDAPIEQVASVLDRLSRAAQSLGCSLEDPFMALSFLALPVIPEIRITDLGLIDVNRFEAVPIFV